MELSGEEKKLQALFSELKTADQETAPRFARVWNGATPGARRAFVFNPAFVAGMALLVCAVILVAVWSRYRPEKQPAIVRVGIPAAPNATPAIVSPTVAPVVGSYDNADERKRARRNRATVRRNSIQLAANRKLTRDAKAITDWESPTSALLSSPSDALFSSLPQLNENANGLQSFLPNRPN